MGATVIDRAFGLGLRTMRVRFHKTQEELAKYAGCNRVTVSDVERGKRGLRFHTAVLLAEGLGVTADVVLGQGKVLLHRMM